MNSVLIRVPLIIIVALFLNTKGAWAQVDEVTLATDCLAGGEPVVEGNKVALKCSGKIAEKFFKALSDEEKLSNRKTKRRSQLGFECYFEPSSTYYCLNFASSAGRR